MVCKIYRRTAEIMLEINPNVFAMTFLNAFRIKIITTCKFHFAIQILHLWCQAKFEKIQTRKFSNNFAH